MKGINEGRTAHGAEPRRTRIATLVVAALVLFTALGTSFIANELQPRVREVIADSLAAQTSYEVNVTYTSDARSTLAALDAEHRNDLESAGGLLFLHRLANAELTRVEAPLQESIASRKAQLDALRVKHKQKVAAAAHEVGFMARMFQGKKGETKDEIAAREAKLGTAATALSAAEASHAQWKISGEGKRLLNAVAQAKKSIVQAKAEHKTRSANANAELKTRRTQCRASQAAHTRAAKALESVRIGDVNMLRSTWTWKGYAAMLIMTMAPGLALLALIRFGHSAYKVNEMIVDGAQDEDESVAITCCALITRAFGAGLRATWWNWLCIIIYPFFLKLLHSQLTGTSDSTGLITIGTAIKKCFTSGCERGQGSIAAGVFSLFGDPNGTTIIVLVAIAPYVLAVNVGCNLALFAKEFCLALLPKKFVNGVKLLVNVSIITIIAAILADMNPAMVDFVIPIASILLFGYISKFAWSTLLVTLELVFKSPLHRVAIEKTIKWCLLGSYIITIWDTHDSEATSILGIYIQAALLGGRSILGGYIQKALLGGKVLYNVVNRESAMEFELALLIALNFTALYLSCSYYLERLSSQIKMVKQCLFNFPISIIAFNLVALVWLCSGGYLVVYAWMVKLYLVMLLYVGQSVAAKVAVCLFCFMCCLILVIIVILIYMIMAPFLIVYYYVAILVVCAFNIDLAILPLFIYIAWLLLYEIYDTFVRVVLVAVEEFALALKTLCNNCCRASKKSNSNRVRLFFLSSSLQTILRFLLIATFAAPSAVVLFKVGHLGICSPTLKRTCPTLKFPICPAMQMETYYVWECVPSPTKSDSSRAAGPKISSLYTLINSGKLRVEASGGYSAVEITFVPLVSGTLNVLIERGTVVQGLEHEQPLIFQNEHRFTLHGIVTSKFPTFCKLSAKHIPHSTPRIILKHLFLPVYDGTLASQGAVWSGSHCKYPAYAYVRSRHVRYTRLVPSAIKDVAMAAIPNPTALATLLLWFPNTTLCLIAAVGACYAFLGATRTRVFAPTLAWLFTAAICYCEQQNGDPLRAVSSAAFFGTIFMVLAEIPESIAAAGIRLAVFATFFATYTWLSKELFLAGPDFHFGRIPTFPIIPPLPKSVDGTINASINARFVRLALFSARTMANGMIIMIKPILSAMMMLIQSQLGVGMSVIVMYTAVVKLTPRLRRMADERRGEDSLQCVLCAGTAASVWLCAVFFIDSISGGVLIVPPPAESFCLVGCVLSNEQMCDFLFLSTLSLSHTHLPFSC
tara:strand:- start:1486 stop:5265 length:3780 start_codon:yes stop_codon:yes gene_type:complete